VGGMIAILACVTSETKKASWIGLLMVGGALLCSIAIGYFLIDMYYIIAGAMQQEKTLTDLSRLDGDDPEFRVRERPSIRDNGRKMERQLQKVKIDTPANIKDWDATPVKDLLFELQTTPFATDRVKLCEKFVSKLPKDSTLDQTDVDSVLRHFGDVNDGLKVLNLFDPYLKKKKEEKPKGKGKGGGEEDEKPNGKGKGKGGGEEDEKPNGKGKGKGGVSPVKVKEDARPSGKGGKKQRRTHQSVAKTRIGSLLS